jgi:hypothetical protein
MSSEPVDSSSEPALAAVDEVEAVVLDVKADHVAAENALNKRVVGSILFSAEIFRRKFDKMFLIKLFPKVLKN